MLWFVNPRRIQKQNLRIRLGENAQNAVARSLRRIRNNRDLLSDDLIQQGRFADVGSAYHGDKTRFIMFYRIIQLRQPLSSVAGQTHRAAGLTTLPFCIGLLYYT